MSWLPRLFLAAGVVAGLGGLAAPSQAASISAAPALGSALAGRDAGLLEEVRYVTRCRPVIVQRRDRRGRPVRVQREECRRIWVPGGRGRY